MKNVRDIRYLEEKNLRENFVLIEKLGKSFKFWKSDKSRYN